MSSEIDGCTAVNKCEVRFVIQDSEEFCQMPQHAYHLIGWFLPTIAFVPVSYIEDDLEARHRKLITVMQITY